MQNVDDVLERTAGQLIVACQAHPGEPMRAPGATVRVGAAVTHPTSLTRWLVEAMR